MIRVVCSDITQLQVDVIVNAANKSLLGGGGVDGAIHRAAGHELLEYCNALGGCETGEARITPGFKLPAKWVIHAVGPVWHGGDQGESELLENCYQNSFQLALDEGARSIAFPAISTGVYRFPKDQAAMIAIGAMKAFESHFDEIIACCFSTIDEQFYVQFLTT